MTRRSVQLIRSGEADGLAVVKITETDEAGWPSPAWYAVRVVPGVPGGYALARLGTRTRYTVELGPGSCECLGSGGDGSRACRHVGALRALHGSGQLRGAMHAGG